MTAEPARARPWLVKAAGRLRQVAFYLWPRVSSADEAWARTWLNAAQSGLFERMARQDRAHAIRVARRLEALHAPASVLEAALLHDCGKPAGYGLVGRVLGVLAARWLDGLPAAPPRAGLARQLQIFRWHDAYGLEAASAAGTSPDAMALLAAYLAPESQTERPPVWLEALAAADDRG